ncbi:MAG TPA: DUF4474 domain-containing protein [Oscillospiraceae bacterium]|nr:DUF4474 domain-containing protein [Oscillospiraceae bacterium]
MFFNKKKIIAIISLLLAVCVFASCGGKPTKIDDSTVPSDTEVDNALNDLPDDTGGDITEPSTVLITGPASVNVTSPPTQMPTFPTITTRPNKTTTTTTTTTESANSLPDDLSQMSLKEIQDALFAEEDANTAGKILTFAGFQYDPVQGIYYSHLNPLQRKFGFNPLYDAAAPFTGMIYYTRRVFFQYDEKDWMIQVWKGQYGITVGAEIGVYNKSSDRDFEHYDCAGDDDLVEMTMFVYKGKDLYFTRGPEEHWWLTGFKLLDATNISEISVQIIMKLKDKAMANAMEKGLKNQERDGMTYVRTGNTFCLDWPSTAV